MLRTHSPGIKSEMMAQYCALPSAFLHAAGSEGEEHWLHITGNARRKIKKALAKATDALSTAAVARQFLATAKATVATRTPRDQPQPVPPAMADPGTLLARAAARGP